DQLADLVLALLHFLRQMNDDLASVVELDDALGVGVWHVAVGAVGFNGVEVGADEGGVEHGSILETVRDASQKRCQTPAASSPLAQRDVLRAGPADVDLLRPE